MKLPIQAPPQCGVRGGSREGRAGKNLRSDIRDPAGMVPRATLEVICPCRSWGAERMTLGPGHTGSS